MGSQEYAAAYYRWLTAPKATFRETAEDLLRRLIDAGYESIDSAKRLLEITADAPEYPHDESQLTALETGRTWLKGVLPTAVVESDDVFAERMALVRQQMRKAWKR